MKSLNIAIVTGLSGSGKSTAINALEDAGYFCVDNLPVKLLPKFLELRSGSRSGFQNLALGMDLREREFLEQYQEVFDQLREKGYRPEILFLEASEDVLLKRFSQTRRQHPLSGNGSLLKAIQGEKKRMKGLRQLADKVIDTSNLTVHQLKMLVIQEANKGLRSERMRISIISFGFKHGLPLEADLLMDVRFIPNPYFVPELKLLDGKDERVRRFVESRPETRVFYERYFGLLEYLIPLYEKEGKSYLTLAVGCTGGRHRSVTVAEEIRNRMKESGREVTLTHRDIEMG